MAKQRISYVPLEKMDAEMREEMERCQREGTPRPESSAVRAHVPACFWFFRQFLAGHFPQRGPRPRHQGALPALRVALGAVRILRQPALGEGDGERRRDRRSRPRSVELRKIDQPTTSAQKAALAYAEAITWRLDTDDAFWDRLHQQFSEPELVELGCFDRAHVRPAELAAAPQHRAPRGHGGHRRLDGAWV